MPRVEEIRVRRPSTVWRGEHPIVESGKAYIPDNEDRAQRIVDEMARICGLGHDASNHLYDFALKQLNFAQRDCGHDACKHVWVTAALDNSVHCVRCGISHPENQSHEKDNSR